MRFFRWAVTGWVGVLAASIAVAAETGTGGSAGGAAAQVTAISIPAETPTGGAPLTAPGLEHLAANTPVTVEVAELISTRINKIGDSFALKLAKPIEVNGKVVAPAGAEGRGEVVDAGRPGIGGKPGKLVLAARYVEFDGKKVPLRSMKVAVSGEDAIGASMAVGVAIGIVGIFVEGGHIEVAPGTTAIAKVAAAIDLPPITNPGIQIAAQTPVSPASIVPAEIVPATANPATIIPVAAQQSDLSAPVKQ